MKLRYWEYMYKLTVAENILNHMATASVKYVLNCRDVAQAIELQS